MIGYRQNLLGIRRPEPKAVEQEPVRREPRLGAPDTRLLEILTRAAETGAACPTNSVLAELLGYAGTGAVSGAVKRLEDRKLIKVERRSSSRTITIVATGRSTSGAFRAGNRG